MTLLEDLTVILTGAGGGIGRHLATALGEAGARVALTDLPGDGLQTVEQRLADGGVPVLAERLDGTDPARFAAFLGRVHGELGPVDGLVTCAGFWQPKPFADISVDELTAMLMANLVTTFVACQAVLPEMIERGGGSIVNFAFTAGEYGSISPARTTPPPRAA